MGREVPITSEPREEEAPGVPKAPPPSQRNGANGRRGAAPAFEERDVVIAEPGLSEETNRRLTDEVRAAVGASHVRVPRDRPHPSRGERPETEGISIAMSTHRMAILGSFAILVTVGLIIALATGKWWVLPLAAGAHALGTMLLTLTVIRMTTVTEHPSPGLASAMAEEGIPNPDEHFTQLVQEFSGERGRGTADVLSPGSNERTVAARESPAAAAVQQRSALSPTEGPSKPVRAGGPAEFMIWTVAFALFALSIALPPVSGGGYMWLLTAAMVPLVGGWAVYQRQVRARPETVRLEGRGPLLMIVICTAIAVAVFCTLVALAFKP